MTDNEKLLTAGQRKKPEIPALPDWVATPLIVCLALFIGALIILAIGADPLQAYRVLLQSAFGSVNGFAETMVKACPLLFAGLGIAVAYRAKFWNIGAEGQIYMGGILSAAAGLYLGNLPAAIHLPLTLLAGLIGGAVWGLIPGWLKARYRVNEIISTLMLNYIVIQICSYLIHSPMRDTSSGINISPQLLKSAWLPIVIPRTRFHLGILLAIIIAFAVHFIIHKTIFGYQIRAVGENTRAARFAGIPVERTIIFAVILSGALAGLAGAAEVSGIHHRLIEDFSPGYGYLAIAVALLGNLEPIGIIFSSVLFAALLNGAEAMQRAASVPVPVINVIEGLVIIFIAVRFLKRSESHD